MSRAGKRLVDILVSATGLVVLSPFFVLITVAIWISMGSPVLFRQTRPGYLTQPIQVLKFRTMRNAVGADGTPLADSERLTPLGRFLRRTSMDEIPQLLNVLTGDISLVGPRPLLERYLPYYTERERLRFAVKPGITGWAQIHGRNQAAWNERLENDAWYVDNWSFWLDCRILCMTAARVLGSKGVVIDPRSVMKDLDEERSTK